MSELAYPDEWIARFLARVATGGPDECWPWQGAIGHGGYGRVGFGRRRVLYAHRVAKEVDLGRHTPGSVHVCHRCDNPPCCNPAHLFLGDNAINTADCCAKGRNSPPPVRIGADNGNAKLTAEIIREIRQQGTIMTGQGWRKALAQRHGISRSMLWKILTRRVWRWCEQN